eukprot:TRINITY_DN9022_c0_g1_i1.p1 TRINITY_DN9022_c0_g1~~TRINITY_DN9022_c0_g1_i1.p1  ORF type:complete len:227 (+),score=32.65 TRINITY_DN9022_c0_g1_i1:105-683(+)
MAALASGGSSQNEGQMQRFAADQYGNGGKPNFDADQWSHSGRSSDPGQFQGMMRSQERSLYETTANGRSMAQHQTTQQMAARFPPPSAHPAGGTVQAVPPVQLIIQNKSTTKTEQVAPREPEQAPPCGPSWGAIVASFWSASMNRYFVLGTIGGILYIVHGQRQHHRRMNELQKRIDQNPFLSFVQKLLGAK